MKFCPRTTCLGGALLVIGLLLALPQFARATVVDAHAAEATYERGDFKDARDQFAKLFEQFRTTPSKDSNDWRTYREAAYIFDRMEDCCFTQRDWDGLKHYADGLLVVTVSERNLTEAQLRGALYSGIAQATADYLAERLDESVRLTTVIQLKRSIALVLYDTKGQGSVGEGAIKQYQTLAQTLNGVLDADKGYYEMNIPVLTQRLDKLDRIYHDVSSLTDINALWNKYPPASSKTNSLSDGEQASPAAPAKQ
jgi:hypothetical protein